jgi:hypothetical protein
LLVHSRALRIVALLIAAALVTTSAEGQGRRARRDRGAVLHGGPEIGIHAGYNFEFDHTLIGAQASYPLTRGVEFYPSFDYYTGGGAAKWGMNFDLKLRPPARHQFWYGGGGLNLLHAATTTSHFNLFAGFAGRPEAFRPYAEVRITLGNGSALQLVGGLSFPLR